MKLRLYIQSSALISSQHTFEGTFLDPVEHSSNGMLQAVQPDYAPYIPPVPIRRMSRMLKMAIAAGVKALRDAGVDRPAAILTGSGRASMSDTESFLSEMIRTGEGALNPTPFIQSTYNSPNGWLALLSGCTGYNTTYAHRGLSLEWALMDAAMLFAEGEVSGPLLVGCYDEITPVYHVVKEKIGYWKETPPHSLLLLDHAGTPGTIGGEGAAGFVVRNECGDAGWMIDSLQMLQHPDTVKVEHAIREALHESTLSMPDIDGVILGLNGDQRFQSCYDALMPSFEGKTVIGFKHLCGEFDTAVSFALWLAGRAFTEDAFPQVCIRKPSKRRELKTILLVNHYLLGSWSVMVLRKV